MFLKITWYHQVPFFVLQCSVNMLLLWMGDLQAHSVGMFVHSQQQTAVG